MAHASLKSRVLEELGCLELGASEKYSSSRVQTDHSVTSQTWQGLGANLQRSPSESRNMATSRLFVTLTFFLLGWEGSSLIFHVHKSTPAEKSKSRQVKNPLCQSHRQAHSLVKRSIGPTLPNLITIRITDTNRMLECTPPHSGYERNSDAVRQPSSPDRCSLRGHPNFSHSRIAFVRFAVCGRISFVAPVALALRMIQP